MLKTIHLKNVKGHKDSKLELSPGLNMITGDTDAGKSTFSRAFNWLITNQRGYNPRPWKHLKPKGPSVIAVETVEGDIIERVKHTGINAYKLNGEEFKALGSDVPEEIQNVLRLQPINVQAQKDAYYLLNDTSGAVAKEFNQIANLEKMDSSLNSVQKRKRDESSAIDSNRQALEVEEQNIKDLEFVPIASDELSRLESKSFDLEGDRSVVTRIKEVVNNYEQAQDNCTQIAPAGMYGDFSLLQDREVDRSKVVEVTKVVNEYVKAEEALSAESPDWDGDIAYLQGEVQTLEDKRSELSRIMYLAAAVDKFYGEKETIFVSLALEEEKLKQLKDQQGICQECGRPL